MYNYVSFIVSQTNATLSYSNIYLNVLNKDSSLNIWKFYFNLINKDSGLYNSNFHKSLLLNLVCDNRANLSYSPNMVSSYTTTFSTNHFNIASQTYKKLFFILSSIMPTNYYS
jgi:hypothetical protein